MNGTPLGDGLAWSNAVKKMQSMKEVNTMGRLFLGRTWVSPFIQAASDLASFSFGRTGRAGADWDFSSVPVMFLCSRWTTAGGGRVVAHGIFWVLNRPSQPKIFGRKCG